MTMGLKVRRVLEEDIKKKAKERKVKSDDVLESVYEKVLQGFKETKEKSKKPRRPVKGEK